MPSRKHPCSECKDKHVKCDEAKPVCGRCQSKGLTCVPPISARNLFRQSNAGDFDADQRWVKTGARAFRFDARTKIEKPVPETRHARTVESASPIHHTAHASELQSRNIHTEEEGIASKRKRRAASLGHHYEPDHQPLALVRDQSSHDNPYFAPRASEEPRRIRKFPLEDVQEACLLRYYVEELSHWFDLCDENRHFQFAVPLLARRHSHLLNAIFAVAARHLSRMPRFKTRRGIEYHGQLLPKLDQNAPMEYTLQCIPAMRQFHDLQDNEYRESIVATAVILRQLEEIDDEEDERERLGQSHGVGSRSTQINFLPIIDAILRSPPSRHLFAQRGVTQASYWMALRQEIYHSFTRREPPQMFLAAEYWLEASRANKSVMHSVQVAKWCWGDRSHHEWDRLMNQQQLLEDMVLVDYKPILKKPPDKARGEIFPTVWYASTIEVTSNQQAIISRSVLMAENPRLQSRDTPRTQWRQLENDVKGLILELCGIALCHPASPPVLVNAAIGIQLYGDFFTDQYDRQALKGVVEKYRDTHAWPVKKLLDMFP